MSRSFIHFKKGILEVSIKVILHWLLEISGGRVDLSIKGFAKKNSQMYCVSGSHPLIGIDETFLTRYDSVNQWISPEDFLIIPNFLHNFKVLYQSTFVPKVGCPNPYWSGASAI